MEKFADKLNWAFICQRQKLSEEFCIKYAKFIDISLLQINKNCSADYTKIWAEKNRLLQNKNTIRRSVWYMSQNR